LNTEIHPTAVLSPHAEIAEGVKIGPYSMIGDHVTIGRETEIGAHVVIEGHTQIGERNKIYPFTCIGTPPQDIGYRGEDTRLVIGDENLIREYATIHRATTKQDWVTTVGNNNYIMAYAHVAHDCALGDVPPFMITAGERAKLYGVNRLGLRRLGFSQDVIEGLKKAYRIIWRESKSFREGIEQVRRDLSPFPELEILLEFLDGSKRGILR